MSDASVRWFKRVEAWRASGETAEEFSGHEGFAANTLRWWASKLKREPEVRLVRLARVVRSAPTAPVDIEPRQPVIVIEALRAGARIAIERGADRATLTMVFELLGLGSASCGAQP
jgi:hypothetical protein